MAKTCSLFVSRDGGSRMALILVEFERDELDGWRGRETW